MLNFIQESVYQLGYPLTDINGFSDIGFMHPQTTTKNGRRFSTAKSFLKRALRRKNLDILLKSYVTKVLLTENTEGLWVKVSLDIHGGYVPNYFECEYQNRE